MYLKRQLNSGVRWLAIYLSCFTMAFSPLAVANEAEKISRNQLESYVKEVGLTHNQTWAQFFAKTKDSYPTEVAAKIQEFVNLNPDTKLPQVKLKTLQAGNGKGAPVLEIYDNGKTHTIQIVGESEKWAKVDGFNLSEADIAYPENALDRLQASNIFLRNEADAYLAKHNIWSNQKFEEMKSDFSRFKGFPRMTPKLWAAMTKSQRKEFFNQIAVLWEAANNVLAPQTKKSKSKSGQKTSLIENYIKFLFISEAFAVEGNPLPGGASAISTPGVPNTGAGTNVTAGATGGTQPLSSQDRVLAELRTFLSTNPAVLQAYDSQGWTIELDRQLVQFEIQAEQNMQQAINACVSQQSRQRMDNAQVQRTACENFQRQLLINERVIAPFRQKSCVAPSRYIGLYLTSDSADARAARDELNRRNINPDSEELCSCNSAGSAIVKYGQECPQGSTASVSDSSSNTTGSSSDSGSSNSGSARRRGGSSSIWPLAIGGAAVGILAGLLFFGGKKKKANPTPTAANSTTAVSSCAVPKVGTAPNCACGPCAAPQRIFNFVACQCTNLPGGVICPNNLAAPNGDVSKCAKCSDGTYKTTEACPQVQPACVGVRCGAITPAVVQ